MSVDLIYLCILLLYYKLLNEVSLAVHYLFSQIWAELKLLIKIFTPLSI